MVLPGRSGAKNIQEIHNMSIGRIIVIILLAGLVLFGLIQLVPYGRAHANPTIQAEPNWDSPATRALAVRACYDCHSNETVWPWYSNVAPFSWLIQHDVDEGRRKLNFSAWGQRENEVDHASRLIQRGEMPPSYYGLLHPNAKLTAAEKEQLINGLTQLGGGFGETRDEGSGENN
jgi:hypothetical protein